MQALFRTPLKSATYLLAVLGAVFMFLRLAAPWPVDGREAASAELATAISLLEERADVSKPMYVSLGGGGLSNEELTEIRAALPRRTVRSARERSSANDTCADSKPGLIQIGPCKVDDFIEVRLKSMPLWRVALVSARSSACTFEFTLVRGAKWQVISRRGLCI